MPTYHNLLPIIVNSIENIHAKLPISNCNLTKLIKSLIIMSNKLNNKYYFQFFIDRSMIHLFIFNFSILGRSNIQYNHFTATSHNHYICSPFLSPLTNILYKPTVHKINPQQKLKSIQTNKP